MAYWGEAVGGANPRGFTTQSTSAMQLLYADPPPKLLDRLKPASAANVGVVYYSISGGYAQLDFGKGFWKNFLINKYLQKRIGKHNDGLVPETSSDLSRPVFNACAPGCVHVNNYSAYSSTNHSYLVNNQIVALHAIECAQ